MVKLDVKKIYLLFFTSKQNYLNNMGFQSLSPFICLMAYHLHEFIADKKEFKFLIKIFQDGVRFYG